MELTILGCSGSYGGPHAGACSGYLVRDGSSTVWIDCGNGTFGHLQEHVAVEDLTALVITHAHPDHCVDLYGLHVMCRYALHRVGLPVYAPAGLERHLGTLVDGDWGGTFSWHDIDPSQPVTVGSMSLCFARTDHPPPTYAVEITANGSRLVYRRTPGRVGASPRSRPARTWCCPRPRICTTASPPLSISPRRRRAPRRAPPTRIG